MAECVNAGCRAVIPDDYAFCPFCGTDNRPPESRKPVCDGRHVFPSTAEYCILCGEPRDEPYPTMRHRWRMRVAWSLIVAALLAGGFAALCAYLTFGSPTASHNALADWCRAGAASDGMSGSGFEGNGVQAVCWAGIAAFTFGSYGIHMLLGLPLTHRYRSGYRARGCLSFWLDGF